MREWFSKLGLMEVKRKDVWGLLRVLLLGQLVAFSMATSSFTSSLIADLGNCFMSKSNWPTHTELSVVVDENYYLGRGNISSRHKYIYVCRS